MPEKGLEISELAIADVAYNTACSVSVWQTPDTLTEEHTRMDRYIEHFIQDAACLPSSVRYVSADGYYAENKFAEGVTGAGYHLISKLRHDANLRYLYTGKQKPEGRPEMYDEKVRFDNLTRFGIVSGTDNISLYTAVVNSPSLKRNIRIVYPVSRHGSRVAAALLFSADIHLPAQDILRFYKARFRIGFLFRDAKQSVGLSDCQARCEISPDFRFNACMTALNLMNRESRRITQNNFDNGCPVASIKIRNFNKYLLKRFITMSGIDFSMIKSADIYNGITASFRPTSTPKSIRFHITFSECNSRFFRTPGNALKHGGSGGILRGQRKGRNATRIYDSMPVAQRVKRHLQPRGSATTDG